MKTKKLLVLVGLLSVVFLLYKCAGDTETDDTPYSDDVQTPAVSTSYSPVNFPDPQIPGFSFPEDSTVINGWIYSQDTGAIYDHVWGIWAGLTTVSDQYYGDDTLLVFETWLTPEEISDSMQGNPVNDQVRNRIRKINQHAVAGDITNAPVTNGESVKYDPYAATYALQNQIFFKSVLDSLYNTGAPSIPDFPNQAITIKPVFFLVSGTGAAVPMPVWTGPPAGADTIADYTDSDWENVVFISTDGTGQGNGQYAAKGDSPTPSTTYNMDDFISYELDAATAAHARNSGALPDAEEGDFMVLQAMHVTTREVTRWTWQSFFWQPDAANPFFPASAFGASHRPVQLSPQAAHYGAVQAYFMVRPPQPAYNGTSTGGCQIAYNPYLEASLSKFTKPGIVINGSDTTFNQVGMRSNCMSCHYGATYQLDFDPDAMSQRNYTGDTYIALNDTMFDGLMRLEFAWSIAFSVVNDR